MVNDADGLDARPPGAARATVRRIAATPARRRNAARAAATALLLAVTGCAAPEPATRIAAAPALPEMRLFAALPAPRPTRSNASIARDILDLTFALESGRALPVLTRIEGPITVRAIDRTGGTRGLPPTLLPDLDGLIGRLRREAGLNITRTDATAEAAAPTITVQTVPRAELQRAVPQAACFVVPRVANWDGFRADRRGTLTDWTTLTERRTLAVFVPADVAPQEIRDCLHEEVAQAIGPLNDLYILRDSVFNDDNFHTVLTGFDMLVLRALYDPALRSGMTRAEVAARLPDILARINPAGRSGRGTSADRPRPPTTRDWTDRMEAALGAGRSDARRRAAAREALGIAAAARWADNRTAFALFALGRLSLRDDPEQALAAFLAAGALYSASPDTAVHEAHISMQLAAFAMSSGDARLAIRIVDRAEPAVRAAQNAALLSTLQMVKASALGDLGRADAAVALRAEALGWARYGFGDDAEVRRRAAEIADLAPPTVPSAIPPAPVSRDAGVATALQTGPVPTDPASPEAP